MRTITQCISQIENIIYTLPYDDLTDYLKGVRQDIIKNDLILKDDSVANFIVKDLEEVILK